MKGLVHWVNKSNRFAVVLLHYSADPDKDPDTETGRIWFDKARAGATEDGWQREMEINWSAGAGKPVYPEFSPKQIKDLTWHPEWIIYRGWDRGYGHPACHWSTIDNQDRWLWLDERLGTDIGFGKFIDQCMEVTNARFPKALILDFFPVDTKISQDATDKDEKSPLEVAQGRGLAPIIKPMGVLDGVDIIRKKMRLRADGEYGMLVDPRCKICIEGLQGGYHRPEKEEKGDLPVKDGYFEHLMDASRYSAGNLFDFEGRFLGALSNRIPEPEYAYDELTGFIES